MKKVVYRVALFPITFLAGLFATKLSERYAASLDMWEADSE